jgi:hypothetical protein
MDLRIRILPMFFMIFAIDCAPKRAPEPAPKTDAVPDIRMTRGSETLSASTGTIFFIDGKRLAAGMSPKGDDIGDVEMIPAPSSEMIFGPEANAGIVRITTKSHLPPASKPGCHVSGPYFKFQVSQPAQYQNLEWDYPHPTAEETSFIVQFVVDTMGRPEGRSLHVLFAPTDSAARAAQRALNGWRFTPAMFNGCRVPQLVQTAVTLNANR